jgi:hypothetical protein
MTTHGDFATKWWYRKRIMLLDSHVMHKPREHEASAGDAIAHGDFRAAAERLRAGEELVTLANERIHQFREGVDRVRELRATSRELVAGVSRGSCPDEPMAAAGWIHD